MRCDNILAAIGHTPLVEVARLSPQKEVRIFAKLEGQNVGGSASVKDRIAKYMIQRAEETRELTPDKIILEATSGNTGISLAMIGRRKGYRVKVVMPDNVSLERRQLLELYGAEVILSQGIRGTNGAIELATELAQSKAYYMPNQFANLANPLAHYETTGKEILEDLADLPIDVFVAGIGTGGTITGVGRRLREHYPQVRLIGVEPPSHDLIDGLRNLNEGFIPPVLDLNLVSERAEVTSEEAIVSVRELLQKEGIFAGISSGAAMHQAIRVAKEMNGGNIVVILPDAGWKYLSLALWAKEPPEIRGRVRNLAL